MRLTETEAQQEKCLNARDKLCLPAALPQGSNINFYTHTSVIFHTIFTLIFYGPCDARHLEFGLEL